MPIIYNNQTREFHLHNNEISYIFNILKNNQLGHLYFGKKVRHRESFSRLLKYEQVAFGGYKYEDDKGFCLDYIKQEYPTYGTSDYKKGAYEIKQNNGSIITNFEYISHGIYKGKKKLSEGNMPSIYVEEDNEATSVDITLQDSVINVKLVLTYTIYEDRNVVSRSVRFENESKESVTLDRALSMCVDFDNKDYEMLQLSGAWSRERHIEKRLLHYGDQAISSVHGSSSAYHNPFFALKKLDATEDKGDVYGFSLVYSGNFLASVEVNHFDISRVLMGINPFNFSWELEPNDVFQTPEVVMVYSDEGLNKMSQIFHSLYTKRLMRGIWRDRVSPILINNWEATYFDFDEERLLDIAKEAKELGVELFVLDDGWFGERNSDEKGLGDWYVNYNKLPNGIKGLSNKINQMGMKFGLWIEPEMVNKSSELYKQHPDWIISVPDRESWEVRNQYVLDYSRKEVIDYIYEMLCKVLDDSNVSYIKWDMNRNITEPFSAALEPSKQGEFMHRYIMGVYDLYNRLTSRYPEILFESCSGGGGRFDPGLLYYAPQTWTSDNTDAVSRLKIQYGTSLVYPLKSIGSHVSAVPNHQVGRITSLSTRANVAYFGTFGYELDATKLTPKEKEQIKFQIGFFKEYSKLIHEGTFYRLRSPFEGDENMVAWMVVSQDKKEAILGLYQALAKPNPKIERVELKGLNPDIEYQINDSEDTYYGDELMNIGLIFSDFYKGIDNNKFREGYNDYLGKLGVGDFSSEVIVIKSVN